MDAEGLSTHALADLVLSQPDVGTTIKTDGEESDPYAFLSVLNIGVHSVSICCLFFFFKFLLSSKLCFQANVSIKSLVEYILAKSKADHAFHESLSTALHDPASQVGLVLCERLINMPVPVIPPMYRMLVDEIKDAVEEVRRRFLYSYYMNLLVVHLRANHSILPIWFLYHACTSSARRKRKQ